MTREQSEQSEKTEKRSIFRNIVVPAATVLLIVAGALVLRGAIRADQERTDSKVVHKPVVLEHVNAMPTYEETKNYTGKLPEGCNVVSLPPMDGIAPPANALTAEEAAAIGAWNIQWALGAPVTGDIFVEYYLYQFDNEISEWYTIYAGGEGELTARLWEDAPDAPYLCTINAITGEMRAALRQSMKSVPEPTRYYYETNSPKAVHKSAVTEEIMNDPEGVKRAIEFVTEKYLREDQAITGTYIGGTEWLFQGERLKGGWVWSFDYCIKVEPCTGYSVHMWYPGYEIDGVIAYTEEEWANSPYSDVEWVEYTGE